MCCAPVWSRGRSIQSGLGQRIRWLSPLTAAVLLVLGLAGVGCTDSSGPAGGVEIAITVARMRGPDIGTTSDSVPFIACGMDLHAHATGTGYARWRDATLSYFIGRNRAAPAETSVLEEGVVHSAWRSSQIAAGDSQQSQWSGSALLPHLLRVGFRYYSIDDDREKTASVEIDCAPEMNPDAAPPTVSAQLARPPFSPLEPGDELLVGITATADAGLWLASLILTGPCREEVLVAGLLDEEMSFVVPLTIPTDCGLGVPFRLAVTAMDAALREDTAVVLDGGILEDGTPPRVFDRKGDPLDDALWGRYFTHDTMDLTIIADDNHQLARLTVEVLPHGFQDMKLLSVSEIRQEFSFEVQPDWVGPVQLRVTAQDSSGNTTTFTTEPGAVEIFPTTDYPTTTTTIAGEIRDLVVDIDRGALYLLQTLQRRILVMSSATVAATDTIPTLGHPVAFDPTPSGDSLIVLLVDPMTWGVVDLTAADPALATRPYAVLDTTRPTSAMAIRTTATGKALVSGGSTADGATLLMIDLATGAETERRDADVSFGNIGRSYDHSALVLHNGAFTLQRYDPATDTFAPARTRPSGCGGGPSLDRTGENVSSGMCLYDAQLEFVRRAQSTVDGPFGVPATHGLAPATHHFHGLYGLGLLRSRVSDGRLLDRIRVPHNIDIARYAPDESLVVLAQRPEYTRATISVVRLQ